MNQIHVLMFILTRYAYLRTKSVGKWFLICMCASQVGALGFGTRVSRYDWRPTSTYRLLLKHTARGNVYEEKHVLDRWRVSSSTMHTFTSSLPPSFPTPPLLLSSSHPSSLYLYDLIPRLTVPLPPPSPSRLPSPIPFFVPSHSLHHPPHPHLLSALALASSSPHLASSPSPVPITYSSLFPPLFLPAPNIYSFFSISSPSYIL